MPTKPTYVSAVSTTTSTYCTQYWVAYLRGVKCMGDTPSWDLLRSLPCPFTPCFPQRLLDASKLLDRAVPWWGPLWHDAWHGMVPRSSVSYLLRPPVREHEHSPHSVHSRKTSNTRKRVPTRTTYINASRVYLPWTIVLRSLLFRKFKKIGIFRDVDSKKGVVRKCS